MSPRIAVGVLVALFVGGAVLIALEFANGAADAGALAIRDPCEPRSAFPGEGIDATLLSIDGEGDEALNRARRGCLAEKGAGAPEEVGSRRSHRAAGNKPFEKGAT